MRCLWPFCYCFMSTALFAQNNLTDFYVSQTINTTTTCTECAAPNSISCCTLQAGLTALTAFEADALVLMDVSLGSLSTFSGDPVPLGSLNSFGPESGTVYLIGESTVGNKSYLITFSGTEPWTTSNSTTNYFNYDGTNAYDVAFQNATLKFPENNVVYINGLSQNWGNNTWECIGGTYFNFIAQNTGSLPTYDTQFSDDFVLDSVWTVFNVQETVTVVINGEISEASNSGNSGILIGGLPTGDTPSIIDYSYTGTLVLNGTNTFTGGVSLLGGTLEVSSDSNLGSVSGVLNVYGGQLTLTGSASSDRDFAMNAVTGFTSAGSVSTIQIASGDSWIYTGKLSVNTTSSSLVIQGGGIFGLTNSSALQSSIPTLTIKESSTFQGSSPVLANTDITVNEGSTVIFIVDANAPFGGTLTGEGTMQIQGTSTLTWTPASTTALPFSGTITLSSGTIEIQSATALGNPSSLIGEGGGLYFFGVQTFALPIQTTGAGIILSSNETTTISEAITGTGSVTIRQGTIIFKGSNTYSGGTYLTGGVLSISTNVLGTGTIFAEGGVLTVTENLALMEPITLSSSSTINADSNVQLDLTGTITIPSSCQLNLGGGGTITIQGEVSGAGTVKVSRGTTCTWESSSPSSAESNDPVGLFGSLINGTGTMGTTYIYGAIGGGSPNNDLYGTLTILNSLTLYDGAFLYSVTREEESSLVFVQGDIELGEHAHVLAISQQGDYSKARTYPILSATGAFSGHFESLTTIPAFFLVGELSYDAQTAYITLTPELLSIESVDGINAEHVAKALNETILWNRSHVHFIPTPEGPVPIPAPKSADVLASLLPLSTKERDEAINELYATLYSGVIITGESNLIAVGAAEMLQMQESCGTKRDYALWFTPFGSFLNQESIQNSYGFSPSYHSSTGGGALGLDRRIGNFRAGVLGAYTYSHMTWKKELGKGNLSTGYVGPYLAYLGSWFYANASFIGGFDSFSGSRLIDYVSLRPVANYVGSKFLSHLDAGMNYTWGNYTLRPFDRFDYVSQKDHGYNEVHAGEFGLHVGAHPSQYIRNELGLQFAACFTGLSMQWNITPKCSWVREIRLRGANFQEELLGSHESFSARSYFPNRNLFAPGCALSMKTEEGAFGLHFSYTGEFGAGYNNQHLFGGASFAF